MSTRRVTARGGSWVLSRAGLGRLMHLIHGRAGGGILCYHHISAGRLEVQLTGLLRWYRYVSLDEIVSRMEAGQSTAGLLAITFDDGFAAEVESASALALRRGWPMTFYLATEFLHSRRPFWFEQVGPLLRAAPSGDYRVRGFCFHLGRRDFHQSIRDQVVGHLFHRTPDEIDQFMSELRGALFGSDAVPAMLDIPEPVSPERVRELSRRPEIDFQSHSVSHPFLAGLSEARIQREMEQSKTEVEEMTGRTVQHFCYPYGDKRSIGSRAPDIARRIFRSAATVIKGRCHQGADRALLPRIALFDHDTQAMAQLRVAMTR